MRGMICRFRKGRSIDAGASCNFLIVGRQMASVGTFCETVMLCRFRKNRSTDAGTRCNFLMLCRRMTSCWTFCEIVMLWLLVAFSLGGAVPPAVCAAPPGAGAVVYQPLPAPGERIPIAGDRYFTYGFSRQPKLGTAIMRVEIFDRDGKRDTSFVVRGDADMPSMRGAHSTGDKDFAISAKGVYLLPIRLVMPGDWEIRFTFVKQEKAVFHGAYLFDL